MKFTKYTIFFLVTALIAAMLLVGTAQKREAQALGGATALIVGAIGTAQRQIGDFIVRQGMDIIQGMGSIVLEGLYPAMEEDMQDMSREQIAADIEGRNFDADLANVRMAERRRLREEMEQARDLVESQVTPGECQAVASARHMSSLRNSSRAYQAAIQDCLQRSSQNRPNDCLSEATGMPTTSALQRQAAVLAFRQRYTCSKDEHAGNISQWCQNTDEETVDRDLCGHLLVGRNTIPREDFRYLPVCLELLAPPIAANPLPRGIENEPNLREQYLRGVREQGRQNVSRMGVLAREVGCRMEPQDGDCAERKAFVNALDERLGRPSDPNRPCPSECEFEYYRYIDEVEDPQFVQRCSASAASLQRCDLDIRRRLAATNARTEHAVRTMELMENAMDAGQ